jgi:glycosyltransferase involved in cell wall biosynthesis
MQTSSPFISVVIPCYNAERFLAETIETALAQTIQPLEIIVVDDGSSDGSAAVARSFGNSVRLLQQTNQGESVARNNGIEASRGEWIALLDSDDLWDPRKLEKQVELIGSNVVCVHTPYRTFGASEDLCDRSHVPENLRYSPEYVCTRPFITPSSVLVRAGTKARFPTWTRYGEDTVYFLDLLAEGIFRTAKEPLTKIRRHAGNQSGKQAVEIDWHRTMLQWLKVSGECLSEEQRQAIRLGWRTRLIRAAWRARWEGRKDEYESYRAYLGRSCTFWSGSLGLAVSALRTRFMSGN